MFEEHLCHLALVINRLSKAGLKTLKVSESTCNTWDTQRNSANPECEGALQTLKEKLVETPLLVYPDFSKGFCWRQMPVPEGSSPQEDDRRGMM